MRKYFILVACGAMIAWRAAGQDPCQQQTTLISTLADFRQCLIDGWNSSRTIYYGNVCELSPNVYA